MYKILKAFKNCFLFSKKLSPNKIKQKNIQKPDIRMHKKINSKFKY